MRLLFTHSQQSKPRSTVNSQRPDPDPTRSRSDPTQTRPSSVPTRPRPDPIQTRPLYRPDPITTRPDPGSTRIQTRPGPYPTRIQTRPGPTRSDPVRSGPTPVRFTTVPVQPVQRPENHFSSRFTSGSVRFPHNLDVSDPTPCSVFRDSNPKLKNS